MRAWRRQSSLQLDKVSQGQRPEHLFNTPRTVPNPQLRIWLAIPAIITVSLRVLKYVMCCVFEVTRYVIHVTRNLNYVTRFLS